MVETLESLIAKIEAAGFLWLLCKNDIGGEIAYVSHLGRFGQFERCFGPTPLAALAAAARERGIV